VASLSRIVAMNRRMSSQFRSISSLSMEADGQTAQSAWSAALRPLKMERRCRLRSLIRGA
jgi:hypothetical protein